MTTGRFSNVVPVADLKRSGVNPNAQPHCNGMSPHFGCVQHLQPRTWRCAHRRANAFVVCSSKRTQTLPSLCHDIQSCFFELCIQNAGRPAGAALAHMVKATVAAFKAGHSMSRLRLEVEHGGFGEVNVSSASCRLTESDKHHRQQFLDTVYLTMQMLVLHSDGFDNGVKNAVTWQREWTEADSTILSMVDTIMSGQANEDEMTATKFDRALATAGASGGVASTYVTIAPQFVPIPQLILMTMKAAKELEAE